MIDSGAASRMSHASSGEKRRLHRVVIEISLAHRHSDAERVAKLLCLHAILELQTPPIQFSGKDAVVAYLTKRFVQLPSDLGGSQLTKLVPGRIDMPKTGAQLCCVAYDKNGNISQVWVPELSIDGLVCKITIVSHCTLLCTAIPYAL